MYIDMSNREQKEYEVNLCEKSYVTDKSHGNITLTSYFQLYYNELYLYIQQEFLNL